MKILTLRLKNLNSLKGESKIDFTQAPFLDNGLFAITGPTGAGKSTLLDAICLALYHETPRLKNISASVNDLMTRHTACAPAPRRFRGILDGWRRVRLHGPDRCAGRLRRLRRLLRPLLNSLPQQLPQRLPLRQLLLSPLQPLHRSAQHCKWLKPKPSTRAIPRGC